MANSDDHSRAFTRLMENRLLGNIHALTSMYGVSERTVRRYCRPVGRDKDDARVALYELLEAEKLLADSTGRINKPAHGSAWAYLRGCHCGYCCAAHTEYQNKIRNNRYIQRDENGHVITPGIEHGASCYTNHGCHCDICRADHAAKARRQRAEKRRPSGD